MSKSIRASILVLFMVIVHFLVHVADIYTAHVGSYVSLGIALFSLTNMVLTLVSTSWRKTPSTNE